MVKKLLKELSFYLTKNLMYRDAILGKLIYVHGSKFPKENISWIK